VNREGGAVPTVGRGVILAVSASLLWAAAIVMVKAGLEELPPLTFASLRYLIGAVALGLWRTLRRRDGNARGSRLETSTVGWLLVLALVLYALVPAAQFLAIDRLEAVTFNFVFQAGIPLVLALAAGTVLREPTSQWEWAGVALVIAGIYIFYPALTEVAGSTGPTSREAVGIALAAGAAVGIGASNLIQRQVMRSGAVASLDATLGPMAVGSAALLAYALAVETVPDLTASQMMLILVLGIVNTALAFTMWHEAMRTLKALHAGIIASAQIIEVPIIAWMFLGERLTAPRLIGSVVVLTGILAVHISKAAAAAHATEKAAAR
jgi:drug/metabolite transporter (DMT)-like permease